MGFIARAFTPSPGPPPGSAANPLPLPPGSQTDPAGNIHIPGQSASGTAGTPPAAPPLPSAPAAPKQPPTFSPGSTPGARQKAAVTATTMLGAAATAGQQAKKTLLGQ